MTSGQEGRDGVSEVNEPNVKPLVAVGNPSFTDLQLLQAGKEPLSGGGVIKPARWNSVSRRLFSFVFELHSICPTRKNRIAENPSKCYHRQTSIHPTILCRCHGATRILKVCKLLREIRDNT